MNSHFILKRQTDMACDFVLSLTLYRKQFVVSDTFFKIATMNLECKMVSMNKQEANDVS